MPEQVRELDQAEVDLLVVFRMGIAGDQAFGDEDNHRFAQRKPGLA